MSEIGIDLSELPGGLARELVNCRHNRTVAAMLAAEREQAMLAADLAQVNAGDRRSIDGLGRPVLEINPVAFNYWGQRFGTYDCWHDAQFLREFARDNPAARVRATGTKVQVGYSAARTMTNDQGMTNDKGDDSLSRRLRGDVTEGRTGGRFRKSYGARVGEAAIQR